jgi:hypothetical protein
MVKLIGKDLIDIYIEKAKDTEKYDLDAALKTYESARRIAQKANERQSEATISHKIGELYYSAGRF